VPRISTSQLGLALEEQETNPLADPPVLRTAVAFYNLDIPFRSSAIQIVADDDKNAYNAE
jgi:hypothetical protein